MRVLHFYKTYYPDTIGGIEQTINQFARAALPLSIQTNILTLSRKNIPYIIKFDGHNIYRAKMDFEIASTPFSFSIFSCFAQLVQKADIIHYHYPWPFMDFVHFVTRVKKPTIITYHSDIVRQNLLLKIYRPLQKCFLNSVDQIVATSPNYFETNKVLSQYSHKTLIVPIGIDKSTYPIPSEKLLTKWRNQIGPNFFLFVGVLRYYKGLYILLDALKIKTYPVVIVGSGPIENNLKLTAKNLGLQNIHFLGTLSDEDKVALLKLCTAVVFPSHLRSEAFGISLLEGAMYGKAMISSEIGTGTSYINIHNKTGLVVPPNNPVAFSRAMQFIWENPEIANEMGIEAEKRYYELFTADKMAIQYAEIYKNLLLTKSSFAQAHNSIQSP